MMDNNLLPKSTDDTKGESNCKYFLKKCPIQSDFDNLGKQPQTTEVIFRKAEYKALQLKRMTEVKNRGKTGQAAGSVEGMSVPWTRD